MGRLPDLLPSAVRGGALPAVLLAPCLLAAVLLLRCAAIAHRAAPAAVEVG